MLSNKMSNICNESDREVKREQKKKMVEHAKSLKYALNI